MGIPLAELQQRVSSRDFAEYWAHHQLEPWGLEREDLRAGIVASTIANANRDPKKRAQPYTAFDFVPQGATDEDESDEDEVAARIDAVMVSLGGETETETETLA